MRFVEKVGRRGGRSTPIVAPTVRPQDVSESKSTEQDSPHLTQPHHFSQISIAAEPVRTIQPKLAIHEPHDAREQEADRIAARVVTHQDSPHVAGGPVEADKQATLRNESPDRSGIGEVLAGGGHPLDPGTQRFMEARIGFDFHDVRIHDNARAAASARSMDAHAYTVGSDIVFGTGQYSPDTREGQKLLAHELSHTVQQRASATPTLQRQSDPATSTPAPPDASSASQTPPPQTAPAEGVANTSPEVQLVFDPNHPWLFEVHGKVDEMAVKAELYGDGVPAPLIKKKVVGFDGFIPHLEDRYVVLPWLLRPQYAESLHVAMEHRKTELDIAVKADAREIKNLLIEYIDVMRSFSVPSVEERVIAIMQRWADESFPYALADVLADKPSGRSLDALFLQLSDPFVEEGIFVDTWTNYYSLILNHFNRADEVRAIRDQYSRVFVGDEAVPESPSFMDILWDDLKSGEVASRIGNYLLGMGQAGIGLLEGVYTLITDPGKVLEGLANLPKNLSILWGNREQLFNAFVNADPDEQARMIGRLTGELELILATAGAGGGESAAAKAPELATAVEIVGMTPGGAAIGTLGGGEAIAIDLGKLGTEGARMTSLTSMAGEAGSAAEEKAEELTSEPAKEPLAETSPTEPPLQKEFGKGEWDRLSSQEQKVYIDRWMKEHGVTRLPDVIHDHHAWPKYLGGPEAGPLIPLDARLHRVFHAGLDQLLPRKPGAQHYAALSDAEKAANIKTLKAYARDFDLDYGTKVAETLAKALTGTPYE